MQDKIQSNSSMSTLKNTKPKEYSQKKRQSSQLSGQKKCGTEQINSEQLGNQRVLNEFIQNFQDYLKTSQDVISSDVANQARNVSGEKIQKQNFLNQNQSNLKKKCITMGLVGITDFDEEFINELTQKNDTNASDNVKTKAQTQLELNVTSNDKVKDQAKSQLNLNEESMKKLESNSKNQKNINNQKLDLRQQLDLQISVNNQLKDHNAQKISKQNLSTQQKNQGKSKQKENKERDQSQLNESKVQKTEEKSQINQQEKLKKRQSFKVQGDPIKNNFCSPKEFLQKQKQEKINKKFEEDFQTLNQILLTPQKDKKIEEKNENEEILEDQNSDQNEGELKQYFNDEIKNEELVVSDDKSSDDDDDSNDDKIIQQMELLKEEEEKNLRDFAIKNGFNVQDLFSNSNNKKELNDIYEEAANFKITQEFLDQQEILDRERFFKQMYRPPALDILEKKYINKEPVRTGFNQGLIPIQIQNNYESQRTPQGPQIIITTVAQKRKEQHSSERDSRLSLRQSHSKDSHINKFENIHKQDQNIRQSSVGNQSVIGNRETLFSQSFNDEDEQQKVQFVQQAQFNETSLRHLFYLEYKKNFQDGQANPIVYSRFGKSSYNSNEKFDPNNFNQLLRTCNLKKILKNYEVRDETMEKTEKTKIKRKFQEPLQYPCQDYYQPKDANDKTLIFESRFESGNLQLAHKVSDNEYDLILQNDINSKGHTQWFYFRVNNIRKGLKVKFNILNMIKSKSLYNEGMKVLMYSQKKQEYTEFLQKNQKNQSPRNFMENSGWFRGGEDIGYYQNNYKKESQTNSQRCYFTFTFTHTFDFDNDYVYFAYSQPYTYTNLTDYLCEISQKQLNYVTRKTLCRTVAGNKCEYLSITNRVSYDVDKQKEGVVLTARIHPGESISSWIMKGIIDFLISSDPKANELRDKFVFKIVPMLNPDGVINGNYRCSLVGCDLNRRWKYPSEVLHPTVYHTKNLIMKLANERPLALYCDIHAHSRRKNIFIYGNQNIENPEKPRAFPYLMSKVGQPHFSYDYSRFNYSKSKEQTARVAVWRELGSKFQNIFTLESSFCGPKPVKFEPHRGNRRAPSINDLNYHFITKDFLNCGQNLCEALYLYRAEKDSSPLGIQNLELQVEQYQIEKAQKMEQEELIHQQHLLVEQRKQQEIQNRQNKNNNIISTDQQHQDSNINEQDKQPDLSQSAIKEQNTSYIKIDKSINANQQSNTKKVKKLKTKNLNESLLRSESRTENIQQQHEEDKQKVKQKANYNLADKSDNESDAQSDSYPSEDNLEEEQILKLIPKKCGKKKYIIGTDEVQQNPKKEKKKEKQQVKTELMPCLQSKRKELEEKQKKDQQTAEKQVVIKKQNINNSISKTTIQKRNGNLFRDVATQIMYISDGSNLSLMEIDILNHTGCKWSPVIYPGYKGSFKINEFNEKLRISKKNEDEYFNKNFYLSTSVLLNQNMNGHQTCINNQNSYNVQNEEMIQNKDSHRFNKNYSHQNQAQSTEISSNCKKLKQKSIFDQQKQILSFENIILNNIGKAGNQSIQNILQQKIQETKFNEPKSLIIGAMNQNVSGSSVKQQYLRRNTFEYGSGKSQESFQQKKNFNYNDVVYDLETVHEKANDKFEIIDKNDYIKNISLDNGEKIKPGSNSIINQKLSLSNNLGAQLKMKKIINGNLVPFNISSIETQKQTSQNIQMIDSSDISRLFQKIQINKDIINSASKFQNHINNSSGKGQIISLSVNSTSKIQQSQEKQSNFSKVGQQILLNNSDTKKQQMNFQQHVYEDLVAQGTTSNFSFNQQQKMKQERSQYDFLTNQYQNCIKDLMITSAKKH